MDDQVQKTLRKYDQIHDWHREVRHYRKGMHLLANHPHEKIDAAHLELIGTSLAGKRVLEIGCGVGHLSRQLASRARLVCSIDLSAVVWYAARTNPHPRIHYLCANANQLPFADHAFDALVCSEVIEHIPTPRTAIREMHRVLAPGGVLCLSTPNLWTLFDPFALLGALRNPKRWFAVLRRAQSTNSEEYDRPPFPRTLCTWFTDSGFSIRRHETRIFFFWQRPYLVLVSLLDRYFPHSERLVREVLRITDALIESRIPPFRWMGTRQFIVVSK